MFLAILVVTCLMTTSVGLLCSALSRRTSTAMVLTYLSLLVLFAAPVAGGQFLANFTGTTEDQLTALQITSPFAAAFSVPLPQHTEALSYQVEVKTQAVPIIPGTGLPLWAGYLIFNPLLALILFGLTYLCFRWRWWRAAEAV